jgi:hypothetical protein
MIWLLVQGALVIRRCACRSGDGSNPDRRIVHRPPASLVACTHSSGGVCGKTVALQQHGGVYLEFGVRQAETERAIAAANGCSRELISSLALLLKPLPIVGAR